MSHDIDDLLDIILQLEKRIIKLESAGRVLLQDDCWYWDH